MKPYTLLLFLTWLISCAVWSQNPGYMGKKTIVGYGFHLSPVTTGSTADNKTLIGGGYGSAEEGYVRFNYTHDFFIERTLTTHLLFGASLKYINTGYDNRVLAKEYGMSPTSHYEIKAFTFTPYFKKYYHRYIAPWGRYFIFGPTISRLAAKHDAFMNIPSNINGHDTLLTYFGADKKQYAFDFLLGFGRNRILANRISLEYGYNFHVLSVLSLAEFLLLNPYQKAVPMDEYVPETIKTRMRGINRFNVFIKIGYLF